MFSGSMPPCARAQNKQVRVSARSTKQKKSSPKIIMNNNDDDNHDDEIMGINNNDDGITGIKIKGIGC